MSVNVWIVSVVVVISADLIAIGDQSGWSCLNSAAMPAMCGADIDVPLKRSNSRPRCPGGATAASTSTPGAPMSGFRRSPAPATSGPREEKSAMNGAGWLNRICPVIDAVLPASAAASIAA